MGIEIDPKYGGTGASFFSSILVIEELAKVDPSVSVFCDVQNTLVSLNFKYYASEELKDKYFPRIAQDTVSVHCIILSLRQCIYFTCPCFLGWFLLPLGTGFRF